MYAEWNQTTCLELEIPSFPHTFKSIFSFSFYRIQSTDGHTQQMFRSVLFRIFSFNLELE